LNPSEADLQKYENLERDIMPDWWNAVSNKLELIVLFYKVKGDKKTKTGILVEILDSFIQENKVVETVERYFTR
jgi:hypothetical protein